MISKVLSVALERAPRDEVQPMRFAFLEFLVLFAALGCVNALVAPGDPGWFAASPTPYLIIPVLLGGRHGISTGLSAGVLTGLLLLVGRQLLGDDLSIHGYRHSLLMHALFGAGSGFVAASLRRNRRDLEGECHELEQERRRLCAERELLLLSRFDLQQRLGLCGADSCSLDEELRELTGDARELSPGQLLSILARMTRVRSAAIYALPLQRRSDVLVCAAWIGDHSAFPEALDRDQHSILAKALESDSFLIQKSLRNPTPSRVPGFLAAYPIPGVEGCPDYVLLVHEIPVADMKPNTFDLMKSICDWMSFGLARPLHHPAGHRAVSEDEFYEAMQTAVETHRDHAIPSILVRMSFDFGDEDDPAEDFRELLEALPPETIVTNFHEDGDRSALFLLPPIADPGTRDSMRAAFASLRSGPSLGRDAEPHFVMTTPRETRQQLWGRLVAVNQDASSR